MAYRDIVSVVKPVVETMGYVYWGIVFNAHGRRALLRVFIDRQGGVSLDDCSKVSRQLSSVLDVEDPIKQSYTLEVSSPGLERSLFELEHYKHYIGRKIKLYFYAPVKGRKKMVGCLESVGDDTVTVKADDAYFSIRLDGIRKANLLLEAMPHTESGDKI